MTVLRRLFEPIAIGSMQLRNRIVMSPMTTDYGSDEGLPSQRLLDYLEERARGGVALVTLEACTVDRRHREVIHSMHFSDDAVIPHHRALTELLHRHGARVQPQLVHPGPDSMSPHLDGTESLGPSVIPSYLTGHPCRALEEEEIPGVLAQFGEAARRAREAGYDGVELHAAHAYMLLGSFLSPLRNRRGDAWGRGADGRLRAVLEAVRAIKQRAGEDFPLTLRLSGSERVPGGRSLAETARLAPRLVAAGVDAFHVSGGSIDRYVTQIVTGSRFGDAHNAGAAAALRRAVDVPIMVVGRIHDPVVAERLLERGDADLVVMGRPLLADPELPRKAGAGQLRSIRRCISCETCIDSMERMDMSCAVNGRSGREGERPLARAAQPKRVLVVGGGPAGLEAARLLALRGHRVTLCERRARLGGAFVLASALHPENEPLLDFLIGQVRALGVELRLGRALDAEDVRRFAPDAVVVATGGRVVTPEIPGDSLPHVATGAGLSALLAGTLDAAGARRLPATLRLAARLLALPPLQRLVAPAGIRALSRLWLPLGPRVAIVGADLAAVELAEFLARRGRRVWLLEPGERIAPEVGAKRRGEHLESLDALCVPVLTGAAVREITAGGVVIEAPPAAPRLVPADSVVIAGRVEADAALLDAVRPLVPEVHAIGDCTGLGLVAKAVREATRVACAL